MHCRWGGRPIITEIPSTLNRLLDSWVLHAHAQLAGDDVGTLLVTNSGRPFSCSTFGVGWRALMTRHGAGASFTFRRMRHIFVEDRLDHPDRPGPSNEDAAHVMGNSVRAWKEHYHTSYEAKAATRAVDSMAEYRLALGAQPLGHELQQQQQQPMQAPMQAQQARHEPHVRAPQAQHAQQSSSDGSDDDEGWDSDFEICLD